MSEPVSNNWMDARPAISVCMAAYNGARYIVPQLQSILVQLADGDEIIVVDDGSTDTTLDLVRGLNDHKIRLSEHVKNRGVSRTFEDAIRLARNPIIFLSDQDDLWLPTKVETVVRKFVEDPELTLVAGDSSLIDENGNTITESYFAGRGQFRPGLLPNLVHNWYGGCTLAFRAHVRSEILPLPHGFDVLHDIWIGVRNSLSGGKAVFLPQPLIINRRHAGTATGHGTLTTARRLRTRLHLLIALMLFPLKRDKSL